MSMKPLAAVVVRSLVLVLAATSKTWWQTQVEGVGSAGGKNSGLGGVPGGHRGEI